MDEREAFTEFVSEIEPRLRRALISVRGLEEGRDAVAEALGFAWEHWDRVRGMANPAGYLFRVGQSRSRRRRQPPVLPRVEPTRTPEVEPELAPALAALSEKQRAAVWLVHGCDWTYGEAAEAIGVSTTALGTHLARGMARLRGHLGVQSHA